MTLFMLIIAVVAFAMFFLSLIDDWRHPAGFNPATPTWLLAALAAVYSSGLL